jgi:hypothetical protein
MLLPLADDVKGKRGAAAQNDVKRRLFRSKSSIYCTKSPPESTEAGAAR